MLPLICSLAYPGLVLSLLAQSRLWPVLILLLWPGRPPTFVYCRVVYVEQIIDQVCHLEDVDDVATIARLMAPGS